MILKLKVWLLKKLLNDVSKHGHDGDVYLAHINKFEDKLLKTVGGEGSINPDTGLVQYKGGGGGQQQTSNALDPNVVPYVKDALSEQQMLYREGAPSYYADQTYLNPNAQQQSAIDMMTANAGVNNSMLQNSTDLNNSMIQGDYLNASNPYLAQATQAGADVATDNYNKAMNNVNSQASMSGRYGSDAHRNLASDNSQNLANALSNQAGTMAYQNYANERGNQINAMNNAGAIAGNQNIGANNLMQAGGYQAQFDQSALDA